MTKKKLKFQKFLDVRLKWLNISAERTGLIFEQNLQVIAQSTLKAVTVNRKIVIFEFTIYSIKIK